MIGVFNKKRSHLSSAAGRSQSSRSLYHPDGFTGLIWIDAAQHHLHSSESLRRAGGPLRPLMPFFQLLKDTFNRSASDAFMLLLPGFHDAAVQRGQMNVKSAAIIRGFKKY